jgi:transcriptional regulator with XRE-family HTH domain
MQRFGEYLRELRTSRGLKLKEVSDGTGIDLSTLSKVELGQRRFIPEWIDAYAKYMDMDPESLGGEYVKELIFEDIVKIPGYKIGLYLVLKSIKKHK